jgi:hypothetical protein
MRANESPHQGGELMTPWGIPDLRQPNLASRVIDVIGPEARLAQHQRQGHREAARIALPLSRVVALAPARITYRQSSP